MKITDQDSYSDEDCYSGPNQMYCPYMNYRSYKSQQRYYKSVKTGQKYDDQTDAKTAPVKVDNKLFERVTPENCVLLLIDLQIGLLALVKTIEPDMLKNNIIATAKMAKIYNIPVILTTSGGTGQNGAFIKEVVEMFPDVEIIDRTLINAWDDKNVVNAVKKTGRKKLLIADIATDVCLTFPAISAEAEGYDVYGILDASGTWSHLMEQTAIVRMAQVGVKLITWWALTQELQKNWALPTGKSLLQLFSQNFAAYNYLIDLHTPSS